jgi:hypothetical protein
VRRSVTGPSLEEVAMKHSKQPQHARAADVPISPDAGPSRRAVIAAGAAGLTLVASGALLATGVEAAVAASGGTDSPRLSDDPVVAHVRDARTGEIDVFVGDRQVRIRDRAVAARLASVLG